MSYAPGNHHRANPQLMSQRLHLSGVLTRVNSAKSFIRHQMILGPIVGISFCPSRTPCIQIVCTARAARCVLPRRIRAAGLVRGDDDPVPDDIDEFRLNLARRIAMLINTRRGCMAPHIACSNAKLRPPVSDEQFARSMTDFQRTLRTSVDRRDAEGM
jgi:hypothetical protein